MSPVKLVNEMLMIFYRLNFLKVLRFLQWLVHWNAMKFSAQMVVLHWNVQFMLLSKTIVK